MASRFLEKHATDLAERGGGSDTAAAWLACGVDLSRAAQGNVRERATALRRIRRAMERERWKGPAAYDLDRHLALKRCRDRLVEAIVADDTGKDGA